MGKWILAMALLLSGCVITPNGIRGSGGGGFVVGDAAIATAAAIVVFGPPDEPSRPYCNNQDPGPPHGCPDTAAKSP